MAALFPFASASSPGVTYTVRREDDGSLSCTCRGWIYCRKAERSCKHTREVAATHPEPQNLPLPELTDAQWDRIGAPLPTGVVPDDRLGWVRPMLASPLEGRSLDEFVDNWWLEEKFDGHRVVVAVRADGTVSAWSRPRAGSLDGLRRQLPDHIHGIMMQFPAGTYDAELIVPGGKSWDVTDLKRRAELVLVIFDLLALGDVDFTTRDAADRREHLDALDCGLQSCSVTAVRIAEALPVSRAAVEAIWARGGEGAVLKRKAAVYRPGARSADWVKVKRLHSAVLTVVGFRAGSFGPHSIVLLRDEHAGIDTAVKTKNADWIRLFDANPDAYIGKRLRIEHQGLHKAGGAALPAYRHPVMDHFVEAKVSA